MNSCGHTTDFYLGKTDLPRAISSTISRGKFIWGFVLPREKFWEGHTTDISCQGFHTQLNCLEPKKAECAGIYLIKGMFLSFISLLFLTQIQHAR